MSSIAKTGRDRRVGACDLRPLPILAELHLARTVCRRVERRLVALIRRSEEKISLDLLAYVNRLSDLLFLLARAANVSAGQPDTPRRPL